MRERRDARASVHVDPDVALARGCRSPCVQSHTDADRPRGERLLDPQRSSGGARCRREGDEEGVTLRVDLDSAVGREGLP